MNRSIYTLILVVAVGVAVGRIMSVQLILEPSGHRNEDDPPGKRLWPKKTPKAMPTFGSNDRSRWATVRALVEKKTYAVGERDPKTYRNSAVALVGQVNPLQAVAVAQAGFTVRVRSSTGIIFEEGYESVDKVLHPDRLDFYSSKPPLFATIVAGLYWLLHLCGLTLSAYPNVVVRVILIVVNVLPFALYLRVFASWLERWGVEPWTRLFVFAAAAFATLVSPFLITLSNHTLATFASLFALHGSIRIWEALQVGQTPGLRWFLLAGCSGSLAVAMELPALSLAAAIGALLLIWSPGRTLSCFVPAALVPAAAYLLTNYLAVGQIPPVQSEFDGAASWYQYEGSHWRRPLEGEIRRGIDWARQHESRGMYAFHVLLGHHGWYSLTPIWWLALAGIFGGCWSVVAGGVSGPLRLPWFLPSLALALSVVVIGFYLVKSDNYGGFTVGLRWLMWLTPLWLVCMIPVVDRLAPSRAGRIFAYVLLGVSILSANYSSWNPWRHPWLFDLMIAMGWPGY